MYVAWMYWNQPKLFLPWVAWMRLSRNTWKQYKVKCASTEERCFNYETTSSLAQKSEMSQKLFDDFLLYIWIFSYQNKFINQMINYQAITAHIIEHRYWCIVKTDMTKKMVNFPLLKGYGMFGLYPWKLCVLILLFSLIFFLDTVFF